MGKLDITLLLTACFVLAGGTDPLCNDMLLQSVPDDHITASSFRYSGGVQAEPPRGRLNTTQMVMANGTTQLGAWAPTQDQRGEYIQVMFDEVTMITGLLNQGRNQGNDYVTSYKLEYTEDGVNWQTLNNDIGVEQIFMGNMDGDSIIENPLDCPIFAKGIRLIPMDWHNHIALRFEVNGCYLDNTVVVVTTTASPVPTVARPNTTSGSFLPGIQTPFGPTTAGSGVTGSTGTTLNMLTLIQWFMTGLYNHTTPAITTTTIKRIPTTTKTTTTTTTTVKPSAPVLIGIQNPFGTTTGTVRG